MSNLTGMHDHAETHDHGHHHGHTHGHEHEPVAPACCHGSSCTSAAAPLPTLSAEADGNALLLRIPAMDCPTEEGQIRRALEGISGVNGLRFDLPARALHVDAPPAVWPTVTQAITRAGFQAQALSAPPRPKTSGASSALNSRGSWRPSAWPWRRS